MSVCLFVCLSVRPSVTLFHNVPLIISPTQLCWRYHSLPLSHRYHNPWLPISCGFENPSPHLHFIWVSRKHACSLEYLDYFSVSFYNISGRHLSSAWTVQRDCQCPFESGGHSHLVIMQCSLPWIHCRRDSRQSLSKPTNYKKMTLCPYPSSTSPGSPFTNMV